MQDHHRILNVEKALEKINLCPLMHVGWKSQEY